MREIDVPGEALDPLCHSPVLFDALVGEEENACVFRKTVTLDDPGVQAQRVTPQWPHHLPGELVIALTGQGAMLTLQRKEIIDSTWRGHGVRIRDARFSAPVLLGELFYTRVEIVRIRRLAKNKHVRFRFRMWKNGAESEAIETYRSEQDAIVFPG